MNMTLDEDDINAYIGAVIFTSINPVCQISRYWSNNERRHNSDKSTSISGMRFYDTSKMLHISIPSQEVAGDKLRKVCNIYYINSICNIIYI